MTTEEDRQLRAQFLAELSQLVGKTPPGIGAWSYDKTHNFIEATETAQRTLLRRNATVNALGLSLGALRGFYE